jgi:C1A family cysteine protease
MRNLILLFRKWILVIPILLFFFQYTAHTASEIEQINKAIAAKGAHWTAKENRFTRMTQEQKKDLCVARIDSIKLSKATLLSIPRIQNLPAVFDWRNNNGNWLTPVKDQGNCGSCWAFSAVAQVESWWKIHNVLPDSNIDLSEQFILSCGGGSCSGWATDGALEFIRSIGIPTESCFPYQAANLDCSNACSNWQDERVTIPGWGYIAMADPIIENIKNAVYQHPISAEMIYYGDFFSYSGGVYQHVWGDLAGYHDILIIGWNDEEESWICKNSMGKIWGEGGYFRIKWGDSDIGIFSVSVWDKITGGNALAVSPKQLDLTLTSGDSIFQNITISNLGSKLMNFSSFPFGSKIATYFHPDSFNAWDGVSWWCGDPQIGGYKDLWLQYLTLPALNLVGTNNPVLSWKGFWKIQEPFEKLEYDYAGNDGCNVWISVGNGKTFNVAYPKSPAYNCRNIQSFGFPCWNIGTGIAGWGGSSGGWIPVEFDLSSYKSDSVVIRFAFTSDCVESTLDQYDLYGFFIDDIIVSDGGKIFFENHGEDIPTISKTGYCHYNKNRWLDISSGVGAIQAKDSNIIVIAVKTRDLEPGDYHGSIYISTNDTTVIPVTLSLNLKLNAPDHDIAVKQLWFPGENIPILFPIVPGVLIKNCGLNAETDFDLVCNALIEGQPYLDTTHVHLIMAGESEVVKFKPILVSATGSTDFSISIININFPDYNSYNNSLLAQANATNIVDGFETETGFWVFEGGWGITDTFNTVGSHSGTHVANVNGNARNYLNNMNTTMTFTPGFNLQLTDEATLSFWTKYDTELNEDVCCLEVSGDSISWSKIDSLSGKQSRWKQYKIDLKKTGYAKIWVRFHFISDNQNTALGVLIDDVEIYNEAPTNIGSISQNLIPKEYKLSQNYPNPFNPITTIQYQIPQKNHVTLKVFDVLGREVVTLVSEQKPAGAYTIQFDGSGLTSGVYFYRLQAGAYVNTKKFLLLK